MSDDLRPRWPDWSYVKREVRIYLTAALGAGAAFVLAVWIASLLA